MKARALCFTAAALLAAGWGCNRAPSPLPPTQLGEDGGVLPGPDGGGPPGVHPPDSGGTPDGGEPGLVGQLQLTPPVGRVVFYAVQNQDSEPSPLALQNIGAGPVEITKLEVSGPDAAAFGLTSPPALPARVNAGDTLQLEVVFHPSAPGPRAAVLTISTNDPQAPPQEVRLRGLGAAASGGPGEPSLQWVMDTFEIPVNVGDPNPNDSAFPTDPLVGEELSIQQFVKAGPGNVTLETLALLGPADQEVVTKVGWYPAGTAPGATWLFSFNNAFAQSVQPPMFAGSISYFDPGTTPFGIVSTWPAFGAYLVTQEDAFNTWDMGANKTAHHTRIYPFRTPEGATVANTYVMTVEESAASNGPDYNDLVMIIRNVRPAGATGSLQLQNLDGFPAPDRMIFNRVQQPNPDEAMKQTGTLRIHNGGSAVVTISALDSTGPYTAAPATPLPAALNPGADLDVGVTFTAQTGRVENGTLTITSDDAAAPTLAVQLAGFWQPLPENENEPPLSTLIQQIFGFSTVVVGPGQRLSNYGIVEAVGDEVLSPYWNRADAMQPVQVRQLAAFHIFPQKAQFFWYCKQYVSKVDHGQIQLLDSLGVDAQSLLPRVDGTQQPAVAEFTPEGESCPAGPFGFSVNGAEFSDPTLSTPDPIPCPSNLDCTQRGHHVRFWPVKDASGALVPNAYLMAMDSNGVNYDYNDDVFLITNITPAP